MGRLTVFEAKVKPQTPFTVRSEMRGDAAIVTASGHIAEMEAERLGKEINQRIEEGARVIVLDLGDVTFVTSACLGVLMGAHKRLRDSGGLRVARPQPLVRQILEITKLIRLFGAYDSVEDALQAR